MLKGSFVGFELLRSVYGVSENGIDGNVYLNHVENGSANIIQVVSMCGLHKDNDYFMKGDCFLNEGNIDDSIKNFLKVPSTDKNYITAQIKLALLYGEKKNGKKALEIVDNLLEKNANHRDVLLAKTLLSHNFGSKNDTYTYWSKWNDLYEGDFESWKMMGQIEVENGNIVKAIEYLDRAYFLSGGDLGVIKLRDDAYKLFFAKNKGGKNDSYKYHYDAVNKMSNGDIDMAISLFSKALNSNPNLLDSYIFRADMFVAFAELSENKNLALQAYDNAVNDIKKALELDINNKSAMANLGYIFFKLGDYTGSNIIFDKLLTISPNFVMAYVSYTESLLEQGNLKKANEIISKAFALNPYLPDVIVCMAKVKSMMGDGNIPNLSKDRKKEEIAL